MNNVHKFSRSDDAHARGGASSGQQSWRDDRAVTGQRERLSAGPQTVRTIFELRPPEESSLQPIVELNREFLQAHHLTPVCEGYTRQYAWFVDDDGQMRHYSELIIPVMAP